MGPVGDWGPTIRETGAVRLGSRGGFAMCAAMLVCCG